MTMRVLGRTLLALGLATVTALAATGTATAEPALSDGCAALHQYDAADTALVPAGDAVVPERPFAAGEQVRFVAAADGSGTAQVRVTSGSDVVETLSAGTGEVIRYPITQGGSYGFELSSSAGDAAVWHPGCGVPPVGSMSQPPAGSTLEIGDQARVYFSCGGVTNTLASCALDGRDFGLCSGPLGCDSYVDTATPGEHTMTVTATDARGLRTTTTATYTVVKKHQTVSITSGAPTDASYRGRTYDVVAQADSGLPVVLSVDPSASGVCAVSGATVSFTGVGTCVVRADQPGDDVWAPADPATQSFTVVRGRPALAGWTAKKGVLGLTATTFKASLTIGTGFWSPVVPVEGAVVTFSVAGKTVCSGTTDARGDATCTATIGVVNALTQSSYVADFAGSDVLEPATATAPLS